MADGFRLYGTSPAAPICTFLHFLHFFCFFSKTLHSGAQLGLYSLFLPFFWVRDRLPTLKIDKDSSFQIFKVQKIIFKSGLHGSFSYFSWSGLVAQSPPWHNWLCFAWLHTKRRLHETIRCFNFINIDYQQLRITVHHAYLFIFKLTVFNCLKLLQINTFFNVSDNYNNDDF
jgi:hypothetical protein